MEQGGTKRTNQSFVFHGVLLLKKNKQLPFLLYSPSDVDSSSSSHSPCALPYQNSAVSMSLHSLEETMTESHTIVATAHDDAHCAFMTLPPYSSTSKDEVHHLSCGPQSCRAGL